MLMPITLQRSFKALTHLFLLLLLFNICNLEVGTICYFYIFRYGGTESIFFFFFSLYFMSCLFVKLFEFTYEIISDFLGYFIVSVDPIIIK